VPRSVAIPNGAADKKAIDRQIAGALGELMRNNGRAAAPGNVVDAGRDSRTSTLLAFYPARKTVPVGTTAEFRMSRVTNEGHTVACGSAAVLAKGGYAEKLSQAFFAPLPGTGQNGPPVLGVPGAALFPSDPGPLVVDGIRHGGFVSAGLLGIERPLSPAAK